MNGRGEIVLNHQVWEAMGKPEAAALLTERVLAFLDEVGGGKASGDRRA